VEGPAGRDQLCVLRYRELLRQLVIREIKLRYKRSVLGFVWTILNPLLAMAIFTMVFSKIFGDRPHYSLYVVTALLGWNLFSEGSDHPETNLALDSLQGFLAYVIDDLNKAV